MTPNNLVLVDGTIVVPLKVTEQRSDDRRWRRSMIVLMSTNSVCLAWIELQAVFYERAHLAAGSLV